MPVLVRRWYREYEQVHFPDPQGLRFLLERVTLGLYPGVIKVSMERVVQAQQFRI